MRILTLFFFLLISLPIYANEVYLEVSDADVAALGRAEVPVSLPENPSEVATLFYRITFGHPLQLHAVHIGPAAQAADKSLSYEQDGQSVLIACGGMNETPFQAGALFTLVLDAEFSLDHEVSIPLQLTDVSAVRGDATRVDALFLDGEVTIEPHATLPIGRLFLGMLILLFILAGSWKNGGYCRRLLCGLFFSLFSLERLLQDLLLEIWMALERSMQAI